MSMAGYLAWGTLGVLSGILLVCGIAGLIVDYCSPWEEKRLSLVRPIWKGSAAIWIGGSLLLSSILPVGGYSRRLGKRVGGPIWAVLVGCTLGIRDDMVAAGRFLYRHRAAIWTKIKRVIGGIQMAGGVASAWVWVIVVAIPLSVSLTILYNLAVEHGGLSPRVRWGKRFHAPFLGKARPVLLGVYL